MKLVILTLQVNMARLPKHNRYRPDFLAPGPNVDITKGLRLEKIDEQEEVSSNVRYTYYESTKTLGLLYRSIDEHEFFQELQSTSRQHKQASSGSLTSAVWRQICQDAPTVDWKPYVTWAEDVKES